MKTYTRVFLISALAAQTLVSCKSDVKNNAAQALPAESGAAPVSPRPEVYVYMATVDRLNMREAPNKTSKVVTQLAEGEFVDGFGEISANKDEATLRGIPYTEPYYKVVSVANGSASGWVFGGALLPVYAGPRHISPDMGKLAPLAAFLKTLDPKQLESGKQAMNHVKSEFATADGTLADAAFILLEHFMSRMEHEGNFYTLTEQIKWSDSDYDAVWKGNFDMNKYPATQSLAGNGFRLAIGEGTVFPVADWGKLSEFFLEKVTPPMRAYMLQNTEEQKINAFDDGGIVIGLDTLLKRAIFWENFNRQNPYFVRSSETKESERWLHLTMLNGSDNTPVFNSEDQSITPEFKELWALVLQQYPDSRIGKDVRAISDLCAAEGWKRTKKVEDLQARFARESQE